MLKNCLFILIFIFPEIIFSQILFCKDGNTQFTSQAPLETIKAQNNKTTGVIDAATKNVAFSLKVDNFTGFNSALQKEHFLENYLEAPKYKTAEFKGQIIEEIDFSKNGTNTVRAKGMLNVHGKEKEKIIKVKIIVKDKEIEIETNFDMPLADHNIKIPKIVNQKISPVINVQVKALLKQKV